MTASLESDEGRDTFVGRDAEVEELLHGLEDALAGRGRLFLLVGEPGIGKSRLADELIRQAQRKGAVTLVGRCWEAGGAPVYWPWVQSLRGYIHGVDAGALRDQLGPAAAHLVHLFPELRELLPDIPVPPPLESEGARVLLFDALASFLKGAAAAQPPSSSSTISTLQTTFAAASAIRGREIGQSRLLVVAALRDVDPTLGEALATTLAEVARGPSRERFT